MAEGTCSAIEDGVPCGRSIRAKGVCGMHYMRLRATGRTDKKPRLLPLADRFHARTIKDYNEWGCWLWTGETSPGDYGKIEIREGGRRVGARMAHAVGWELAVGRSVPASLELDHFLFPRGCIGPRCVRPEHVRPTSRRLNVLRSSTAACAVNARKTHCLNGHPFDITRTRRTSDGKTRTTRDCSICRKVRSARGKARAKAKKGRPS